MSFQQGLSGLNAASKTLEVIGNNVANSNTVGFKESQAQFADVFANSLTGSGGSQIGIGTKLNQVSQQFTQGNLTASNNPLDMAVNGAGFFQLSNSGSKVYSRNGQFHLSDTGEIVNANGAKLMGYAVNDAGVLQTGAPVALKMKTNDIEPKSTTQVTSVLNLDGRATVPTAPFSITDPLSYNNATSVSVFDSQGNSHVLQTFYVKNSPNSWSVYATNDGTPVGYAAGVPVTNAGGTVTALAAPTTFATIPAGTFSINGVSIGAVTAGTDAVTQGQNVAAAINAAGIPGGLTATADAAGVVTITDPTNSTVIAMNGAAPNTAAADANKATLLAQTGFGANQMGTQAVFAPAGVLNFSATGKLDEQATTLPFRVSMAMTTGAVDPLPINIDYRGTTQYGAAFGVNSLEQDGYASGRLSGFNVGADGIISGRYTNGKSTTLGQVVLSNFRNPNGLQPLGDNVWAETSASGPATDGTPGTSSMGALQASSVEDSNVDLTAELVNMITAQRVYQANAQTIKTQDQLMQTLVNMR
jgi:flagellar hook protein FlgE